VSACVVRERGRRALKLGAIKPVMRVVRQPLGVLLRERAPPQFRATADLLTLNPDIACERINAHDGSTGKMNVQAAAEGAEIVGAAGYELNDANTDVLLFDPTTEYREHLGREVRTGRRLVGAADVTDCLAFRGELATRGLPVGESHLKEVDLNLEW